MYKILTVIYLFLSLLISPAWAGSQESANRFRTDFQDYLLTLKSSGVNRVSGVSIETIQARVAQVKIEVKEEIDVANKDGLFALRKTAYWDPVAQTIFISALHINNTNPQSVPGISAHEFYRVAGIYDENYNVSFLSNVFVKFTKMSRQHPELVKHPESLETLKTLIEFQGVKLAESEGGSSGAGGGGDIRSQQFKEAVLEELFFDFDRNQISEMQFILATDILSLLKVELSPVVPNGQFTFENKTRTLLIPKEVLSNENLDLNYLKIVIPVSKAIVSVVSK